MNATADKSNKILVSIYTCAGKYCVDFLDFFAEWVIIITLLATQHSSLPEQRLTYGPYDMVLDP